MDDARRVLAAAVVAEQPAAAEAVLAAVVVAEMPSAKRLEEEAAKAAKVDGVTTSDGPCRAGVKVRPGHDAAVDANLAARDAATRAIQGAARRRLLPARPASAPPPPATSRLVHVGTVFFDGVHSSRMRARLSERFAGGLPLVGLALLEFRLV